MLDLVVSIVNHNNRDLVGPLLDSIIDATRCVGYEIWVVDNASKDGSADMIRERYPEVRLIRNEGPLGYAANHNQVLCRAKGRYFALLNDDMLIRAGALDELVAFMDQTCDAGLVGCKLLNGDGSIQRSCWIGFPSAKALFRDLFYLAKIWPHARWVRKHEPILWGSDSAIEVDSLLGACMLVRNETLQHVGMLDESYHMFLEETDWCYRIKEAGWRIYWYPRAQMVHYGQRSVMREPSTTIPMLYGNYCRFARSHGASAQRMFAIKAIIVLGVLFRALLWSFRALLGKDMAVQVLAGYLRVPKTILHV